MRIGFLGNTNNYPFILARAMQRAGAEVLFLVDRLEPLNRPECRYGNVGHPYTGWIREIPPIEIEDVVFSTSTWRMALTQLSTCDALVVNGFMLSAGSALGKPTICMLTGADLEQYTNPARREHFAREIDSRKRTCDWVKRSFQIQELNEASLMSLYHSLPTPCHRTLRKWVFWRFTYLQARGLRNALAVNYLPHGAVPLGDALLHRWLGPRTRRLFFMLSDIDWIKPAPLPENQRLRLFNATRWVWKRPFPPMVADWENKGNDIMLRGIALFYEKTRINLDLQFIEKGQSIESTKHLARQLGIDHMITWQAELTQNQVFEEYRKADIVAEQFGNHAMGMAGYEAMAMGRPVLANARPEIFGPAFGEIAPIAQARTPAEVCEQLERLLDPQERSLMASMARAFVERNLSPLAAARLCLEVLEQAPGRIE